MSISSMKWYPNHMCTETVSQRKWNHRIKTRSSYSICFMQYATVINIAMCQKFNILHTHWLHNCITSLSKKKSVIFFWKVMGEILSAVKQADTSITLVYSFMCLLSLSNAFSFPKQSLASVSLYTWAELTLSTSGSESDPLSTLSDFNDSLAWRSQSTASTSWVGTSKFTNSNRLHPHTVSASASPTSGISSSSASTSLSKY